MANPSSLLTRLPDELLDVVFSYIGDDHETLDRLCVASRADVRLQEASLTRCWRKTTIDDRDLLPLPGDREAKGYDNELRKSGLITKWKPAGQRVSAMLAEARPGCRPANYVQELIFDLRLFKYYEDDFRRFFPHANKFIPKASWFQYNLQLLAPHLSNLRTIKYFGELPQVILNAITSFQKATQIRSLVLQSLSGQPWILDHQSRRDFMVPQRRPLLDYVDLWQLDRLRSLEVHRLAHAEVPVFYALLPSLSRLENLLIGDEPLDWRSGYKDPAGCGIRIFVEHLIYAIGEALEEEDSDSDSDKQAGLPSSLKSLTLLDRHEWQSFAEAQPRILPTLYTPLTTLHLDLDGLEYIASLAHCFKAAELTRLILPGSTMPYQKKSYFDDVHDVVSLYQDSLKEIKLLQAWTVATDFAGCFNERWQEKFSIQELVLGAGSYTWTSISQPQWLQPPYPALTFYLDAYDAYTKRGNPEQWGSQLERIRIDHIQLPNLDTTTLSQPRFAKVKILMLQPFDNGAVPEEQGSSISWSCKQIDDSVAHRLAHSIMDDASSSLRVIVLQNYWYWVSNERNTNSDSRLWRWTEAEKNPTELKLMRESLSKVDWSFLQATIPLFWNARFRPENNPTTDSSFRAHSPQDISHQWNFMVALPVGG